MEMSSKRERPTEIERQRFPSRPLYVNFQNFKCLINSAVIINTFNSDNSNIA